MSAAAMSAAEGSKHSFASVRALRTLQNSGFGIRLSLVLGISILLLALAGGLLISFSQSLIDQGLHTSATVAQQRLEGEFRRARGLVEALSRSTPILGEYAATPPAGKEVQPFLNGPPGLPLGLESLTALDVQGLRHYSSGKSATSADLRDRLFAEVVATGLPAARFATQPGATRYLVGYPVFLPVSRRLQRVLIAEFDLLQMAALALDANSPRMMIELRLDSGESLLRLGSLPDGEARLSVSMAIESSVALSPPLSLEFSQREYDVLRPLYRLHFSFLLLLVVVVGLTAYLGYRMARSKSGYLHHANLGGAPLTVKKLLLNRQAMMACSKGVMIVNMGNWPTRIESVNPAFEKITGYSAAEIIGQSPGKLHKHDIDQAALRELRRTILGQQSITVTLRNYRKDGSLFWNQLSVSPVHDESGNLTHYFGLLDDVTDQKSAEQELMAWVRRLDVLSTMSADGLVTLDAKNCVTYANETFLRLFGLGLPALMGLQLRDLDQRLAGLCAPGYPYCSIEKCTSTLDTTGWTSNCEMEIQLAQPEKRILLLTVRRGSHETSLLLYFKDITKAREIEQMKSEFLSTAAYELRSPMASILGFSELLLQRDFDAESRRDPLEIIARQAHRVTDLLSELLDLARIEARQGKDFKPAVQDLWPIVEAVAVSFPEYTSRVAIEAPEHLSLVNVDKQKIHQALNNLVDNALKFSSPDEAVFISIGLTSDEEPPRVRVTIVDHGIGMNAEHLARFGERFWRAEPSGETPGTGLGISLVKEIVQLHGGSLEVSSDFGKGSRITLYLPLSVADQATLAVV
jgi:PAS domain S-box-containing protein